MKKLFFGKIHVDFITMHQAVEQICYLAENRKGGYIVTPNIDHIVQAERNIKLQEAYFDATLSLVDGQPLIWMSKLIGHPLPEKISGSDLVYPVIQLAEKTNLKLYLLGAGPGVGNEAANIIRAKYPNIIITGVDSPVLGFENDPIQEKEVIEKIIASEPDIVFVALGCPKQELLMHRWYKLGISPVMLGIGATLDFISGKKKRSPKWMSRMGLEWLFRIIQDPKRLAKRYLINDIAIIPIFLRMLCIPLKKSIYVDE